MPKGPVSPSPGSGSRDAGKRSRTPRRSRVKSRVRSMNSSSLKIGNKKKKKKTY